MKTKIFKQINFKHKVWLVTSEQKDLFGKGRWLLFKTIDEKGSLMAAIEELGISYRKAWNDIKHTENNLGLCLLDKSRGGSNHGSMTLTQDGQKLIRAYEHFNRKVERMIGAAYNEFYKEVNG
jgi:molybdate transport system regulatory protein